MVFNKRLAVNRNLFRYCESAYQGWNVYTKRGDLVENYLSAAYETLWEAVIEHPRTYAIRVDLHLPDLQSSTSNHLPKFMASLQAILRADLLRRVKLNYRVHPCRLRCIWCRERGVTGKDHYHILILLNNDTYYTLGSPNSDIDNMARRIIKAWSSALGRTFDYVFSLVHFPVNPTYRINHACASFDKIFGEVFYRVSYFTKVETKTFGYGLNSFGASRLGFALL